MLSAVEEDAFSRLRLYPAWPQAALIHVGARQFIPSDASVRLAVSKPNVRFPSVDAPISASGFGG